ncbi:transposase [Streptomyces sp. NPDC018036]|uniref:transposase n=1 Tax=Streptomyces sp. NPDC018036 TaxID=3365035 RepID=UPI003792965E
MKNYPPQFKADAVALYRSRPEATIRQVAVDLGINPETLRNWVRAAGASRPRGRRAETPAEPPTPLEAENAALRKKVRELEEEREILRPGELTSTRRLRGHASRTSAWSGSHADEGCKDCNLPIPVNDRLLDDGSRPLTDRRPMAHRRP